MTSKPVLAIAAIAALTVVAAAAQTVMAFNDKNDFIFHEKDNQNKCTNTGGSVNCDHIVAGSQVNTNDPGVLGGSTHENTNCNTQRTGPVCKTNSH